MLKTVPNFAAMYNEQPTRQTERQHTVFYLATTCTCAYCLYTHCAHTL